MRTYLPEISTSDLVHALESQDWRGIYKELSSQEYERLGLDRALTIASDMLARHSTLRDLRILDVGCNNGLVSKVLSSLGGIVVGIDNGDVDGQGLYLTLQSQTQFAGFEFHRTDLVDFMQSDSSYWDCILLLSVTHHWETGYAMSGERRYSDEDIKNILFKLSQKTRRSIYYECPCNEPGFEEGFGVNFLRRFCIELPKLRPLGHTVGPNGYLRELWALDME